LQGSIARRIAMSATKRKNLNKLECELIALNNDNQDHIQQKRRLIVDIERLKSTIAKVPFIDTFDLRFRNYAKQAVPTSKAVMFCLMDVQALWIKQQKKWLNDFTYYSIYF
jgi:hypothetical protein